MRRVIEIIISSGRSEGLIIVEPNVSIFSGEHLSDDPDRHINTGESRAGVKSGDDVWIGSDTIIPDDVTIGSNSVIAVGSDINCNVPDKSLYGGVPAELLIKLN